MWPSESLLVGLVVWLLVGGFFFGAIVLVYEFLRRVWESQTKRSAIKALLGGNALRLYVPPEAAYLARERLKPLRIQLAVSGEEHDIDNELLSEMRRELQMNWHPIREHHSCMLKSASTSAHQASTSFSALEVAEDKDSMYIDSEIETVEVELICGWCSDRLGSRVSFLTLPCMHQFHLVCIFDRLGKQLPCPVCKIPTDLGSRGKAVREDGRLLA